MKRRTIDASKLRRPTKRSRITDSVNGSWLLYLRFFIVWMLIIMMDFALEFRFEFLWPFWLLIRSSFDSFRYQGMALTLVFLCITLLSDIVCFMFLPVHWLFFVASTYVWVQFVITTERGPCIATVSLWLLFVYVEASVRLREIKSIPFHLDICRPFAAHCIGYPVVSLGYGFKSYLGYKVKSYRKSEVGKQNNFYQQLVSYALPVEVQSIYNEILQKKPILLTNGLNTKTDFDVISTTDSRKKGHKLAEIEEKPSSSLSLNDLETVSNIPSKDINNKKNNTINENYESGFVRVTKVSNNFKPNNGDISNNTSKQRTKHKPKAPAESDYELDISDSEESTSSSRLSQDNSPKSNRNSTADAIQMKLKEEQSYRRKAEQQICQQEYDIKKLRNDLHSVRQTESEYRTQVNASLIAERYLKAELEQIKAENESLLQKISSVNSSKSQDKSLVTSLERKLKSERDIRAQVETQLKESKKKLNSENDLRIINHDACNIRNSDLESEVNKLQSKLDLANQKMEDFKKEDANRKISDNNREKMKKDVEILTNALNAIQGKNMHLESSLSSETRLKLDLFSALGETRRQLEITQDRMKEKCKEVDMLKAKIAEVMAVMPPQYHSSIGNFGNHNESKSSFIAKNGQDSVVTSASYSPSLSNNGLA